MWISTIRLSHVQAAYAEKDEGRRVPMNKILTTTLQAVRMSILTDYWSSRAAFARVVCQGRALHVPWLAAHLCEPAGGDLSTVKDLTEYKGISMTLRYVHLF